MSSSEYDTMGNTENNADNNEEEILSLLEQLMEGRLSEKESSIVLSRMTESDEFLDTIDATWSEHINRLASSEPHAQTAQRLEQALANRIQRSELGRQALRLGTQGFGNVMFAFLRPLFSMGNTQKHQGKRYD